MRVPKAEGKFVVIEARNPLTVCCPEALLACALFSLGVDQHPRFPFEIDEEEVDGAPLTIWRWVLCGQSRDGLYQTAQLIQWWRDPAWLAANPQHELAIVRRVLANMDAIAIAARTSAPFMVVRRGDLVAKIAADVPTERRAALLAQLAA